MFLSLCLGVEWTMQPNSSELIQSVSLPAVDTLTTEMCLSFSYHIVTDNAQLILEAVKADKSQTDQPQQLFIDWEMASTWLNKSITIPAYPYHYQVKTVSISSVITC